MSLEPTHDQRHDVDEAGTMDMAQMIDSIQDPKEREAARALLTPKKLTEEGERARKAHLRANREMMEAHDAKHKEMLRQQLTDLENEQDVLSTPWPGKPDQATTQPLTTEEQRELDQNLRQQKELIAKLETIPPQTWPTHIEVTQALSPEERASLKAKLREQETSHASTTNQPPKKASFWNRWFN